MDRLIPTPILFHFEIDSIDLVVNTRCAPVRFKFFEKISISFSRSIADWFIHDTRSARFEAKKKKKERKGRDKSGPAPSLWFSCHQRRTSWKCEPPTTTTRYHLPFPTIRHAYTAILANSYDPFYYSPITFSLSSALLRCESIWLA